MASSFTAPFYPVRPDADGLSLLSSAIAGQDESEAVRTAVDLAAGVIDVAAQLAAFFGIHLLARIARRFDTLEAFTPLAAFAVEVVLCSLTAFIAAILAQGATLPLRQHETGGGNACAEQQKMR